MSLKTLDDFLKSPRVNAWVSHGKYTIYVRRANHWCGDGVLSCFDIASINRRGMHRPYLPGGFWELLEHVEELFKGPYRSDGVKAIYIESILNDRLWESLKGREFQVAMPVEDGHRSLFRMIK